MKVWHSILYLLYLTAGCFMIAFFCDQLNIATGICLILSGLWGAIVAKDYSRRFW